MSINHWKPPNLQSKCKFAPNIPESESPHEYKARTFTPKIASTILDVIGNTPLVRINKITKEEGIECEVLAKCEFLNPGGSVKDRIAKRSIEYGESKELYKPGDVIIEPTSGNTGIGMAMVASIKGYKCSIIIQEKMSMEKCCVLKMLGSQLIRTRSASTALEEDSIFRTAFRLKEQMGEHAHIPYQYISSTNPLAHYDQTAEEIIDACSETHGNAVLGTVDMLVASVGTGGTITGIGRKFKRRYPNCKIIGVDPVGSKLADAFLGPLQTYGNFDVEGIGYDFIPTVLDNKTIDAFYRVSDKETFTMARRIIRQEGLLVGGSSGTAMVGAIKAIKDAKLGKGHRVVVIFADGIRNYMTKFLSDEWMYGKHYLEYEVFDKTFNLLDATIGDMIKCLTIKPSKIVAADEIIQSVLSKQLESYALVISQTNAISVIDPKKILFSIINGTYNMSDNALKVSEKEFISLQASCSVKELSRALAYNPYVLIIENSTTYYILQPIHLLRFMTKQTSENMN